MKMRKKLLLLLTVSLQSAFFAQSWVELIHDSTKTFYDVQAAANAYFKDKDINEPGIGYKPYKRWENFMEPRVFPSGDLSLPSTTLKNFEDFLQQNSTGGKSSSTSASTTYTAMGPMGAMTGSATNGFPRKAGRDNFIAFHPTTPTTFWAGAPAGGLWKTTDGGITWTTNTDNLSVIGCTDLAIDPSNPNTMYLATGDGYAGDTYCIGVLKSIDGGLTWNSTGLVFTVNQMREMRRLLINPNNPQILLAATDVGLYRTTNGGTNWTNVLSGDWYDMEFKPGNPNTVYLGGNTSFRLSTDAGATFTTISNGIPTSGSNRLALAVTPADPNYVYVLRSSSSTSGYAGLYRSTSSGTAFTVMSTSPDVLANACNGTTGGGQGWYDLSIAVSPTNASRVDVGGVNVWSSNGGGATGTWTCTGCWIGTSFPSVYMKADHHDLEYSSTGLLYSASDGGIFRYNSTSWIDLNNQRNIAQVYKMGASGLTANKWISGHQDNGTGVFTNGTYQASYAGDGMDCFIDRTNDQNLFASTPNGNFVRSTNGGASYSAANTGMSGTGAWVTPWKQDPVTANRLYAGRSQLFVSNNLGASWAQAGTTGGSGPIIEFAIAPSNNQVIYVLQGTSIRKTTNGGTSWAAVTSVSSSAPTFITIDPNDANTAWVTVSGYSAGNKVFQTTNGGTSWTNISYNLPNIPANCSVYQPGSGGRLYIGMDVGVYTKDASSTTWTLYNSGLPNTPISDFEISPAAPSLLRVATYGRGIYQVDLVQTITAPTSAIAAVSGTVCSGIGKTFSDNSTDSPNAWNWAVSPSSGVVINTGSSQNPLITFPAGGIYTVSLIASNNIGTGSTATRTVLVNSSPSLTLNASTISQTVCVAEEVTLTANGANTYTWLPGPISGSTLSFIAALGNDMTYTVNARSLEGCATTETISIAISECTGINTIDGEKVLFEVFPNPVNQFVTLKSISRSNAETQVEILDAAGKVVLLQTIYFKKDKPEQVITISELSAGPYILKLKSSDGKIQTIKLIKE
jgi:hypothetical protein